MWPKILDIRRQRDRAALFDRGVVDVEIVQRQHRADAGMKYRLGHASPPLLLRARLSSAVRHHLIGEMCSPRAFRGPTSRMKFYTPGLSFSTSASIRATLRKFAGVMSRSGIFTSNSASTASIRLTMSSDEMPHSPRSSSRPTLRAIDRFSRIARTSAMIRSAVRTGRSEAMRSSTVNSSQIQTKKVALLRNQLLHFRATNRYHVKRFRLVTFTRKKRANFVQ